jgi:hydrogenase maturation protein HypF
VRLDAAGHGDLADRLFGHLPLALLRAAAEAGVNAPMSSSAGRLYDAVAACLGLTPERQSFEGEAAMALQALSERGGDAAPYPFHGDAEIDPAPMFDALARDLAAGTPPETIAARFEAGLAAAFARAAREAAREAGADAVALSGGCFQNVSLLTRMTAALEGLTLCPPGLVPANDGGLAYGQALVALARMESA